MHATPNHGNNLDVMHYSAYMHACRTGLDCMHVHRRAVHAYMQKFGILRGSTAWIVKRININLEYPSEPRLVRFFALMSNIIGNMTTASPQPTSTQNMI